MNAKWGRKGYLSASEDSIALFFTSSASPGSNFPTITNLPQTKVDEPASTETLWQMREFCNSCVEMRRIVQQKFMTVATLSRQALAALLLCMNFATFSYDETSPQSIPWRRRSSCLIGPITVTILPCSLEVLHLIFRVSHVPNADFISSVAALR